MKNEVQPYAPDFRNENIKYLRLKLRSERLIYHTFAGHIKKASTFDLFHRAEINIARITTELQRRKFAAMAFGEDYSNAA